ncbi:MAG: PilN domain-containing protein [Candidatus Ozemobacteraceae bacterium]
MKHLLNIVPTVKYRGESSFMFKTIIGLLYLLPALLALYTGLQYLEVTSLNVEMDAASDRLEKKHGEVSKGLAEARPDRSEIQESWQRILSYHHALKSTTFSWTTLFGYLEQVLPAAVRITRVRVHPEASVKLNIQGEAVRLEDVTDFLRRLYEHKRFDQPRLINHARLEGSTRSGKPGPEGSAVAVSSEAVMFTLDVDYLPIEEGVRR